MSSRILAPLFGLVIACSVGASDVQIDAPNVVVISANVITSGQPTAGALEKLASQGFGAVIYLAPPSVPDAVPGEAEIVTKQGMVFINIPIAFSHPTDADFQAFSAAMSSLKDRKVLVHCQVNLRASSMTFLYRAIVAHESAEQAYESVAKVWSPDGPWMLFITSQLQKAGLAFRPY